MTGIDNDLSFGESLLDPDARDPFQAPRLPRVIDVETASAILALTPDQIEQDCAGLSPAEISATKSRLSRIQERILSFDTPQSQEGQVVTPDANWSTDPDIRKLLGAEAFASLENISPDRMMQKAAEVSYVAREWSLHATFSAGYKQMAIFDPEEVAGWGNPEGQLLQA